MISSRDFDCPRFNQSLADEGLEDQLNDIDSLLAVADDNNCWTSEFYDRAMEKAKKAFLRKLLRDGYEDENGVRHEYMCIEELDPETNETRLGYKQLEFFTLENFEWAVSDTLRRIGSEKAKLKKLFRLIRQKHGKKGLREIQLRLGLETVEELAATSP